MKTELKTWAAYVKTLPEEVRIGLAEYAAKSFLEGIEKGKKLGQESESRLWREAISKLPKETKYYIRGERDLLSAASKQGV